MQQDNRANILFRYGIVVVLLFIFSGFIVGKLFDTTIVHAEDWNEAATKELQRTYTVAPERGNILACNGSVLAANLRFYTVRLDYRSDRFATERLALAIDSLADSMALVFPRQTAAQWKSLLLKPLTIKEKEDRPRDYTVIRNISYDQLTRLQGFPFFCLPDKYRSGMVVESSMRRVNPYGNMARRSIGGVGQTAECSEIHGISGLEKALDSLLYGVPGEARKVPMTRSLGNWTDKPAIPGWDILTTIDIDLQDIVEDELNSRLEFCNGDWGVAVLMDVATGDIKAISNLEKNPRGPGYIEGMNRAVLGYEPGSVVKPISMLIALEDGIAKNLNEFIPTGSGWAYAGGRPITDAHAGSGLTINEIIERSSNIGMAKLMTRRYNDDPDAFRRRLRSIGFFEPMHTGIAGESVPRIDSVANDRGGRIAMSRMVYGYATEIPPLYTLSIYNAIANKGRYVRPRLVAGLRNADTDSTLPVTYIRNRICSEANAEILTQMLTNVVWGDHGTGRSLRNDQVKIAGKTGTCYMIENGAYNQAHKRLAFCGFFPAENPRYSCIVLMANPKQNAMGAASTSGKVVEGIACKLYSRGLLGNSVDFNESVTAPRGPVPTFHGNGTPDSRRDDNLSALLAGERHRVVATRYAEPARGVIPDVRGMSIRDAVRALERAGYNVRARGAGYVRQTDPVAGTRAITGTRVILTLSN